MSKLTNPLNIELERRLQARYAAASSYQSVQARPNYDEHTVDDFIYEVHNTEEWLDLLHKTFYVHLLKFMQKDEYNRDRALKHFYNFTNRVAKEYAALHSPGAAWYDVIPTRERKEIAQRLLDQFEAKQSTGELDYLL